MDESPQAVVGTTFRIVKKGYDPDEVRAYLTTVSRSLTAAQEHAASMEASRPARLSRKGAGAHATAPGDARAGHEARGHRNDQPHAAAGQRTADNTTADARREAEKTLATARAEAETALAGAREEALRLVETARADARRAGENERVQVEEELQQLLARLEFLRDDVTQLDRFTSEQRTRLRGPPRR